MAVEDELLPIIKEMAELEGRALGDPALGAYLRSGDGATFNRLRIEAKTILDDELGGPANNFSMSLAFSTGLSLAEIQKCRGVIQGAMNYLRRHPGIRTTRPPALSTKAPFVDSSRLAQLRAAKSTWDLTRLIRLCEELNVAHANDCFMATAMLGRSILNHVPPLFGLKNFTEVANNHANSSIKKSLQNLDSSLKNIADAHLHVQIRDKEVLPTGKQVDFHADLDVLLGEVVRTLK